MRQPLDGLSGRNFDVAVIGGGINGAASAKHLAAEGYSVLLVDKNDFASGSSSRSSRILSSGLRALAPEASIWEFARQPSRLTAALRYARASMRTRTDFVETTTERVRSMKFGFPIYEDSPVSGWQVDFAFRVLNFLGAGGTPLEYQRIDVKEALSIPLFAQLRAPQRLRSVAMFREYQFDWPERVVVDAVLDAERLGATVRNYTTVERLTRKDDHWQLTLADTLEGSTDFTTITAKSVCNMAGIWIDDVNQRVDRKCGRQLISGTKGVHILVQLAPEYQEYGLYTFSQGGNNEPFFFVPLRGGLHYFGATHIPYHGDLDEIHATEDEIALVLSEADHIFPGLQLKRSDILYTWAGVRPLTSDVKHPARGSFSHTLHDLSGDGLPNFFAMTGGTLGKHRLTGQNTVAALRKKLQPSGEPRSLSRRVNQFPLDQNSLPPLTHDTTARLADIRHAAEKEHAESLVDIFFRRTGAGWTKTMAREGAPVAAKILGECRGWAPERVDEEVRQYYEYLDRLHPR